MSKPVLVTYAGRTGSTAGVAQAIGDTLCEVGVEIDVRPMQYVQALSNYTAVVAGSAIQGGRWLPEAMQFLERRHHALRKLPVAVFAVCITEAMWGGRSHEAVVRWMQPVRDLVQPVSEGYFAGVLDLSKVPSRAERQKFRIGIALGAFSEGDHRDWEAIQAWAHSLPLALKLTASTS